MNLVQLERDAGIQRSRNPLRHYFREDTTIDWPPGAETIYMLQRITGIEAESIYLAFRRDSQRLSSVTEEYELDEFERKWVDELRDIPPDLVSFALRMVAGLRNPTDMKQATG